MERLLLIGIPSRSGADINAHYRPLLNSIADSMSAVSGVLLIKTIICINGPDAVVCAEKCRHLEHEYKKIKLEIHFLPDKQIGKPNAINYLNNQEKNADYLLLLDDDVKLSKSVIKSAIDYSSRNNLPLVGAKMKIKKNMEKDFWSKFIYDVVNIQQIKDVFDKGDNFLFGRFMLIQRKQMIKIPSEIFNEDLYLAIHFFPQIHIISQEVYYYGLSSLKQHFRRVFRLMHGVSQMKRFYQQKILDKYFHHPKNQRNLSYQKIIKLEPYYLFCFLIYRFIRYLSKILAFIFYRPIVNQGWERTA